MKPLLLYLAANARACGWIAFALLCASCGLMLSSPAWRASAETFMTEWRGAVLASTVVTAAWLLAQLLTRDEPDVPESPRPRVKPKDVVIPRPDSRADTARRAGKP